jgi:hypothetical protein
MAKVVPGRFTAEIDGEFVVFLIGMRINHFWKVRKWLPVFRAMPAMLKELATHPEKGMLGYRLLPGLRNIGVVQYWRSFEHLEQFARNPDDPHLEAWRRFNRAVGTGGDVGIWHETYRVPAGGYECVYNNTPVFGLAAATTHVPIARRGEQARERLAPSGG